MYGYIFYSSLLHIVFSLECIDYISMLYQILCLRLGSSECKLGFNSKVAEDNGVLSYMQGWMLLIFSMSQCLSWSLCRSETCLSSRIVVALYNEINGTSISI